MLNADKPQLWKSDTLASIDHYNDWFLRFAPATYREQRLLRLKEVRDAFSATKDLRDLTVNMLAEHPELLPVLRTAVAPPLAQDRLVGLAYTSKTLVNAMEGKGGKPPRLPPKLSRQECEPHLSRILDVIGEMLDGDLFPWLSDKRLPDQIELERGLAVVADRLCGSMADPIVRNAQEKRQLGALSVFLSGLDYREVSPDSFGDIADMPDGCFSFRKGIAGRLGRKTVNIPIDCIISRHNRQYGELPILIEAKSAGDATNTNKRRKEEAVKYAQLKKTYGGKLRFLLFLCGYFDAGYLGYEAAEGMDWIWEHRIKDMLMLGLAPEPETAGSMSVHETATAYCVQARPDMEPIRFQRQRQIDASKTDEERNRLGQFSTPFPLARQMVARTFEHCRPEPWRTPRVLEPSCGSGVFISALLADTSRTFDFTGVERDTAYAEIASALFAGDNVEIVTDDFFRFADRDEHQAAFDVAVANPPYVRHHHIPYDDKVRYQSQVLRSLGMQINGLSGLYVYFILLSDALLKDGAVATWIIPSEFLYTNYGKALREYLSAKVTLLEFHLFASEDVQFDDALVSSCIVTYRKTAPAADGTFQFSSGRYEFPSVRRSIKNATLNPSKKWTFQKQEANEDDAGLMLSELFHVTRGIATGNNGFFVLDASRAAALQLERDALIPLLPGPRFLHEPVIEADGQGEPLVAKPRYLLSLDLPPEDVMRRYPFAYRYLEEGERSGVSEGGLCRMRKFWYMQEKRKPPLYLASYMGRTDSNDKQAIRFFLNRSNGIATNGFICLYPKPFLQGLLNGSVKREKELLEALNAIPSSCVESAGRHYGGGLKKIEPRELSGVRLPDVPQWLVLPDKPMDLFSRSE